ncbi:hypothetical protein RYX36_032523 [Vicia faba]
MAVQDHTNEWPPTGAPFDLHRDEHWTNFDSSVNAVSFGFVATAILISMFLVMAIFERFEAKKNDEIGKKKKRESQEITAMASEEEEEDCFRWGSGKGYVCFE